MLVIDDFLDYTFAEGLHNHILFNSVHKYGHSSIGGNSFYSVDFNKKDPLIDKVLSIVNTHLESSLIRSYANIQYSGMDGDWHYDDGDTSCLIFLGKNIEGGFFQIKKPFEAIEPIFNRGIIFKGSKVSHRGLAPTNNGVPRISLALKLKSI